MKLNNFWERYLGGHLCIGPVVIYGENAMHWAINIKFEGHGYLCFRLPIRCFGVWWPMYLYWSKNATPQGASFKIPKNYGD